MSLKTKIIILVVLTSALMVTGLNIYTNSLVDNLISKNEVQQNEIIEEAVKKEIQTKLDDTEISVLTIANNSEVKEAFANRDRERLLYMLLEGYESIKDRVAQFQFHLPDSTSFLRLHKPEKYGDSLADFRFTVNKANATESIVKGIESGVAGFGLRVVAPVEYNGEHIGTVEFGSNFGEEFLLGLQSTTQGDLFIYTFNSDSTEFIAATTTEDMYLVSTDNIEVTKTGEYSSQLSKDKKHGILLMPFTDFEGEVVGYVKYVYDRTDIINDINSLNRGTLIYTIIAILIMVLIIAYIIKRSFKGLVGLNEYSKRIGEGDLSSECNIKSKDEIGQIANSFNYMRLSLSELLEDISKTIYEVNQSSEDITRVVKEVNNASEEIAKAVEEIAEGATNQVNDANKSLNSTIELSNGIKDIVEVSRNSHAESDVMLIKTEDGIQSLLRLQDNFQENEKSAKLVTSFINDLTAKSKSVHEIVGTIDVIASQTNLLALNAAIEAAKAGDSGRGFAVVAEEVRKLAEQSSNAAGEIKEIINQIISVIDSTKTATTTTNSVIAQTSSSLLETVSSYEEIKEEVKKVISNIEVTNDSANQIDIYKDLVLNSIENISNVSEQSAAATEEISATVYQQTDSIKNVDTAAEQLNDAILILKEKIAKFKLK